MRTPSRIEHGIKCCSSTNKLKCHGCPYQGISGCRTRLFKDTQDYIKNIRKCADRIMTHVQQIEATYPKWISVEERLPRINERVIVCNRHFKTNALGVGIDKLTLYVNDEPVWLSELDSSKGAVTHWMPLPEPPKEEA